MPSELKVNKLSPYTGTTLTLGDSGDTISFASGVLPSLESLTITGDLTVDTDTLYVDSSNNRVGIGTTSPTVKLQIAAGVDDGIFVRDSGTAASSPTVKVQGQRSDSNGSQCFAGGIVLQRYNSGGLIGSADTLGSIYFGGNHTDSSESNISYAASITAVSDGDFNSVSDMPTAITFKTGSTGTALSTANVSYGTERMRIDSSGHVIIPNGVTLGTAAGTYNAANTIDDYEEGTFTPTLNFGTATTQLGSYVKVGNVCHIFINIADFSDTTTASNITITLPFICRSGDDYQSTGSVMYRYADILNGSGLSAYKADNNATLVIYQNNTTGNWSALRHDELNNALNNFRIQLTYFTA